jgi:hypothetical protein
MVILDLFLSHSRFMSTTIHANTEPNDAHPRIASHVLCTWIHWRDGVARRDACPYCTYARRPFGLLQYNIDVP